MRFLKYEKLLSRARTGVPLSAEVGIQTGKSARVPGIGAAATMDPLSCTQSVYRRDTMNTIWPLTAIMQPTLLIVGPDLMLLNPLFF